MAVRWLDQRWHYRRSLASRVTVLTTLAVAIALSVVALGAYVTVRMQMQDSLDESLLSRARAAAASPALATITTQTDITTSVLGAADVRIAFVTSRGAVFPADPGSAPDLGAPELAVARGQEPYSLRTATDARDGVRYRVAAVPSGDGQALAIAQSMEQQDRTLSKLGAVLLIFGVIGVIGAGVAGWAVARNGLRPVRRLTSAIEESARTEDLTPLPAEGDDEVARLAAAYNQLLAAVQASRDRQRRLVADASHELRTPLTSLRTNIDLLTQIDAAANDGTHPVSPQARAEMLSDLRAQMEEMTTLIQDLVELARDEPRATTVEEVDLADVVERAVSRVRRRAPGVSFEIDVAPWWVRGEDAALERAVANLLDNAAKWSPDGGTIRVSLVDGTFRVDDDGPGIDDVDRPHVFERFYRSEESRGMPGSGLGLSIVAQVTERHGGTVTAMAAPGGGARLELSLPGQPDPTLVRT